MTLIAHAMQTSITTLPSSPCVIDVRVPTPRDRTMAAAASGDKVSLRKDPPAAISTCHKCRRNALCREACSCEKRLHRPGNRSRFLFVLPSRMDVPLFEEISSDSCHRDSRFPERIFRKSGLGPMPCSCLGLCFSPIISSGLMGLSLNGRII
jgi:hypothetical protein